MNDYFLDLNEEVKEELIKEIHSYAISNSVPIVTDEGLELIKMLIRIKKAKKILEIGTAIAYSSINMALLDNEIMIDTIERNNKMFEVASSFVSKACLNNRINIINNDALLVNDDELKNDYDIIFIDAAKAQYIKFFTKFSPLLKDDGIIISDNLLFHGLVEDDSNCGKDLRALVRKIKNYNSFLSSNEDFSTTFLRIGDGMAISVKR